MIDYQLRHEWPCYGNCEDKCVFELYFSVFKYLSCFYTNHSNRGCALTMYISFPVTATVTPFCRREHSRQVQQSTETCMLASQQKLNSSPSSLSLFPSPTSELVDCFQGTMGTWQLYFFGSGLRGVIDSANFQSRATALHGKPSQIILISMWLWWGFENWQSGQPLEGRSIRINFSLAFQTEGKGARSICQTLITQNCGRVSLSTVLVPH